MMAGELRQTKMNDWLEFYRVKCPICSKSGGCIINRKGDTVACLRTESKVIFSRSPMQWIHRLDKKREVKADTNFHNSHKKNPDSILDTVYSCMLSILELNQEHDNQLKSESRKLNSEQVAIRQYRSFPQKPWEIASRIAEMTHYQTFKGFPGFYKGKYGWTFSKKNGMLIPYRNEYNFVVGFQTRIDNPPNFVEISDDSIDGFNVNVVHQPNIVECKLNGEIIWRGPLEFKVEERVQVGDKIVNIELKKGNRYFWFSSANLPEGTSAGSPSPVHVAVPSYKLKDWEPGTSHKTEAVWITEGALKADIAVDHIVKVYNEDELKEKGDTVLAVPGVNTWSTIMPVLKNMEVKRVNLAFDMDSTTNAQVRFQLKEFVAALKSEGYLINLVIWNTEDGKGIDDCFLNSRYPVLRRL